MDSNKFRVGIFGSAVDEGEETREKVRELGRVLSKYSDKIILVNGVCGGMPLEVIKEAKKHSSIEVWGYSSNTCKDDQLKEYVDVDLTLYTKIDYIDSGLVNTNNNQVSKKLRNLLMVISCDAGIILSGRWGTMSEFSFLMDFGKIIGVLTGTGGFADQIHHLNQIIKKPTSAKLFFDSSPDRLVCSILSVQTP